MMNTLWLRRLIRKHDTLGHIVAGFYLLGYYLLVRRRSLTLSALVVACAASAAGISLLYRSAVYPTQFQCDLGYGPSAYKIVDLGVPRGADFIVPLGVNSDNKVVSAAVMTDDTVRAFFWQNGKIQDLGALGGRQAVAGAINDRG